MKKLIVFLLVFTLTFIMIGCAAETNRKPTLDTGSWGNFDEIIDLNLEETPDSISDNWGFPSLEEVNEMYAGRLFSMDDFSSIEPGVSTSTDLDALTPYYLSTPYSVGNVYQYPATDGGYIYIVCASTVQAIYLDDSAVFVGTVAFLNMMKDPSLRPPVGRWK